MREHILLRYRATISLQTQEKNIENKKQQQKMEITTNKTTITVKLDIPSHVNERDAKLRGKFI